MRALVGGAHTADANAGLWTGADRQTGTGRLPRFARNGLPRFARNGLPRFARNGLPRFARNGLPTHRWNCGGATAADPSSGRQPVGARPHERALGLSPAVRVTGCAWDPTGLIQIRLEHPDLPTVDEGDTPPQAMIIPQRSRLKVRGS